MEDRVTKITDEAEIERLSQLYPTVEILHTDTQFVWRVTFNGKGCNVTLDKDKVTLNSEGKPDTKQIVDALLFAIDNITK